MSDEKKLAPPDIKRLVELGAALTEYAFLPDYHAGTELWVTTATGHVYHLILLDEQPASDTLPRSRQCRASGGILSEPRVMRINGATFGGSSLFVGRITCGMHLELSDGSGRRIVTTIVQRISVKAFEASRGPVS